VVFEPRPLYSSLLLSLPPKTYLWLPLVSSSTLITSAETPRSPYFAFELLIKLPTSLLPSNQEDESQPYPAKWERSNHNASVWPETREPKTDTSAGRAKGCKRGRTFFTSSQLVLSDVPLLSW
jgi:hypothetical protein